MMSIWRGVSVNKAQSDQFSAQKISQFFAPEAKLQQWIEYSWHFEDMSIFLSLLAKFFSCNSISDHQISSARWCWNVLPKWYGKKIYYLICNLYVPFNSQKSYFNFHLFHVRVCTYFDFWSKKVMLCLEENIKTYKKVHANLFLANLATS